MNVIGYIRVSTDEQSLGLDAQLHKIKLYCDLHEHVLVECFSDEISGYTLRRPGLQSALAALAEGKAEGLIVAKLDRLTRSVVHGAQLLESHFNGKYQLMSVADHIDTRTASGRLILNIMLSVAQWELETIRERTTDALAQRIRNKLRTGGVRYGYDLGTDGETLIPNAREQEILCLMRELHDAGHSPHQIALELTKRGIATKHGKQRWAHQSVSGILGRAGNGVSAYP